MTEIDTLVKPYYLRLLGGNFLREDEATRAAFLSLLRQAMPIPDKKALVSLLNCGGWRERLSASWFIGLHRIDSFTERIADLLIRSDVCFAGQGYCFALARIGSPEASSALRSYLDKYIPVGDLIYDQEWAIGALDFIDSSSASEVSREAWAWSPLSPLKGITDFRNLMVTLGDARI